MSNRLMIRPGAAQVAVMAEGGDLVLALPMPWLAGPREEVLALGQEWQQGEDVYAMEAGAAVAGVVVAERGRGVQEAARELYRRLLVRVGGQTLYRVWNYVPQINDEVAGVENYRAFNAGRHEAFLAAYGADFSHRLPAASALGIGGERMVLAFLAGPAVAAHFENPAQVPAFQYPKEHGATPPSFARGTAVRAGGEPHAEQAWFLSGTASIKGHQNVGTRIGEQAALTFENVRLMMDQMQVPRGAAGQWKIFLRHAADLEVSAAAFAAAFPEAAGQAMFLQAEICRRGLLLEVEATFR